MKTISAARAAALAKEGDTIFLGGCSGEPGVILDAVAHQPDLWDGVTLTGAFIPGVNERDLSTLGRGTRVRTIFATRGLQPQVAAGQVEFLPATYIQFWQQLAQPGHVDIAYVQVPPPPLDGTVSFGVAGDFPAAAEASGARLVGLVNPQMPDPHDATRLPAHRFEAFVEASRPLVSYDAGSMDEATMRIGKTVADLLQPGDTLQLGLGKVQAAVLAALEGRSDLGFHGGMISSPIRRHLDAGTFSLGITTGVALGETSFYSYLRGRPDIAYRPVGHTHDLATLGAIDSFVSVNSVLQVDLFGQANAEMLNGRQISGQGGLIDFVRGASRSKGGRSILALASTAAGGRESRIVPALAAGVPATVSRADADMVVSEHGVAMLREADMEERARRLIEIAHPDFRDALRRAWLDGSPVSGKLQVNDERHSGR